MGMKGVESESDGGKNTVVGSSQNAAHCLGFSQDGKALLRSGVAGQERQ